MEGCDKSGNGVSNSEWVLLAQLSKLQFGQVKIGRDNAE